MIISSEKNIANMQEIIPYRIIANLKQLIVIQVKENDIKTRIAKKPSASKVHT